jgi:hypothetical protein
MTSLGFGVSDAFARFNVYANGSNYFIASKHPKHVSERPVSGKSSYHSDLPVWVESGRSEN